MELTIGRMDFRVHIMNDQVFMGPVKTARSVILERNVRLLIGQRLLKSISPLFVF